MYFSSQIVQQITKKHCKDKKAIPVYFTIYFIVDATYLMLEVKNIPQTTCILPTFIHLALNFEL